MNKAEEYLHDRLLHAQTEPGEPFARALDWCYDYAVRELADTSRAGLDRAFRAWQATARPQRQER